MEYNGGDGKAGGAAAHPKVLFGSFSRWRLRAIAPVEKRRLRGTSLHRQAVA
jgi:hypothetical protein